MESLVTDVFRLLMTFIDDESLNMLYLTSSPMKTNINPIIRSRAEKLVKQALIERPNANWMVIYKNLLRAEKHIQAVIESESKPESGIRYSGDIPHSWIKLDPHQYGLRDLDSLLVLIEVYGKLTSEYANKAWKYVMSSKVLTYLGGEKVLDLNDDRLKESIVAAIKKDDLDEVLALLELPTEEEAKSFQVQVAMSKAASSSRLDILKTLIKTYASYIPKSLLSDSIESNDSDVVTFVLTLRALDAAEVDQATYTAVLSRNDRSLDVLLSHSNPSQARVEKLYKLTSELYDTGLILAVLAKHGLVLPTVKWRGILVKSINNSNIDTVKVALEHIDPNTKTNQALTLAYNNSSRNSDVLQLIVSDPRIDVDQLFTSSRSLMEKILIRLARPRKLDKATIDAEDTYNKILRYMLMKKPSRRQLLGYLISLRSNELAIAAASVLNREREYELDIAPLRALLISLLYPSMTIKEAIDALISEGYDDEMMQLSKTLIEVI